MDGLACPSCRAPMTRRHFEGRLHGRIELDFCFSCHGIWFDEFESLQITPGGIVELFELLHEQRDAQRLPMRDTLQCPRCDERLLHALDRVKSGQFNYHRCLQKHGRFTTFAQFMIEKGFVRQLSGREVETLKAQVGTVGCSGCGAPIDIRTESACGHCRSPIAILDPEAVERALAGYRQAEQGRTACDPNALAEAILHAERQRSERYWDRVDVLNKPVGDLMVAGIELVWKLLTRR